MEHITTRFLSQENQVVRVTEEVSWDTHAAYLRSEAEMKAAKKREMQFKATLKKLKIYKKSLGFGREFSSSNIFRVTNKGARLALIEINAVTARGTPFEYRGPELRQDDQRVLEFLIKRASIDGGASPREIALDLRYFAEEIGWERRREKAGQVDECLNRLVGGVVRLGEKGSRVTVQFISKISEESEHRRVVQLHGEILQMFNGGCTYRSVDERKVLPDGIASWFGGFLRANDDEDLFKVEDLHAFSGSGSPMYKFRENLADAAARLVKAGVVRDVVFSYGKVRVHRVEEK